MIIDLTAERDKRRTLEDGDARCGTSRMTDAEFEEQAERVRSLVVSLLPTMQLGNYSAKLSLVPGQIDAEGTIMAIVSSWQYEWLHIDASVERCARESDEELTYDVLHECSHAHPALMRADNPTPDQRDHEELAATRLGRGTLEFGKRCADQVRDEYEAIVAEKDGRIVFLQKQLKRAERRAAKLAKERAA